MSLSDKDLDKLKPMHRSILTFLQKERRGRLLDAPAGTGQLALYLFKLGFQVHGCDLYPENFQPSEITCQKVDLNKNLPYQDNSFDYVICLESMQYLENHHHLLREFSRILNKGGTLIISFPNLLNIESRLKFLFRGHFPILKPITILSQDERQWAKRVINPLSFLELKLILDRYNYTVTMITTCRIKPKARLFFLLSWPIKLIALIGNLQTKDKQKENIYRILASDQILLGETLIVVAKKTC